MKLSPRQVVASVVGAVVAATIASLISQKGTIIGVAIGAAVATTATSLVGLSIERSHQIVRTVVQDPRAGGLLRKFGQNEPIGDAERSTPQAPGEITEDAKEPSEPVAPTSESRQSEADKLSAQGAATTGPRWNWRLLAISTAVVFVAGVGVVTAIEAIGHKPLSTLVGTGNAQGFSVTQPFGGSSATTKPGPVTVTTTTPTTAPSRTGGTSPAATSTTFAPPSSTTTSSSSTSTTIVRSTSP